MAQDRRHSGILVLIAWLVLAGGGLFAYSFGATWYLNGHFRLCSTGEAARYASGLSKLPSNLSELTTPPYWCARRYIPADQLRAAVASAQVPAGNVDTTDNAVLKGTEIGAYNDTYAGLDRFWGDNIIGAFFDKILTTAGRWVSTIIPILSDQFVSLWNDALAGEDPDNTGHRAAVAYVVTVLFGALGALHVKTTYEWLTDLALRRTGSKTP